MTRRAGAFLALVLLTLAGCGADEDVPVDQDGAVDGPVLTSAPSDGDEGNGAIVEGEILLDGDCLLLDIEGGSRTPVIWPHGTSWQAEPPAVVLTGGEVVEIGGSVTGGGGYSNGLGDRPSGFGEVVDNALAPCIGAAGDIAQFNPGSTVEPFTAAR